MFNLPTGRLLWGALLSVIGVLWLIDNLNLADISLGDIFAHWWPAIFVYFGVAGLVQALTQGIAGNRGILWGTVVLNTFFSAFFFAWLGNLNNWFYVDLNLFWKLILPASLLLAGGSLLLGFTRSSNARSYVAIMGGGKDIRTTWADLAPVAIMGGTEIDLTRAGLPDREVLIDCYAIMGAVEIRVPQGVQVVCDWTGIMGGVDLFGKGHGTLMATSRLAAGEGPVVRIRATTIMGGVKVLSRPAVMEEAV